MRTCAGFAPWSALLLALALPYLSTFVMNKDKPLGKLSIPSPGPRLDCSTEDRLVLFVQVSDVHLSKFDANRLARFESFVQKVLPVVRPSVVLMTGDITDARKSLFEPQRGQNSDEWASYRSALRGYATLPASLPWLDVRGNHDAFNVPWLGHPNDHFASSRLSGGANGANARQYTHTVQTPFGAYRFVGIDAVIENAPTRHFFVEGGGPPNATLVFGHYPTNTIASWDEPGFAALLSKHRVTGYFSGHLHQFITPGVPRLDKQLWGRHAGGTLELELGDFKQADLYRIGAIDHDMLAISDFKLNSWPVGLLTNPKDARLLSRFEPNNVGTQCSHLRALAFTSPDATVTSVKLTLANSVFDMTQAAVSGAIPSSSVWGAAKSSPLWTLEWPINPETLPAGLHKIGITVLDSKGRTFTKTQVFSVDGTIAAIPPFSQAFMTGNFLSFMRTVAVVSLIACVTLLFAAPYALLLRSKRAVGVSPASPRKGGDARRLLWWEAAVVTSSKATDTIFDQASRLFGWEAFVPYICLAHRQPRLFRQLFLAVVYSLIGPLAFGNVYNDSLGVIFSWGLLTPIGVLPHLDACIYFSQQLVIVFAPVIHVLALSAAHTTYVDVKGCEPPRACGGQGAASLMGILSAGFVTLGFFGLVIMMFLFQGVGMTLASPGILWLNTWLVYLMLSAVYTDARSKQPCSPVDVDAEVKSN